MTAPTYSWTDVPDANLDAMSDVTQTDWQAFAQNLIHCREIAYDTASHSPILAHDHDGRNSTRVYPPSPNVMLGCTWNAALIRENITHTLGGGTTYHDSENGGEYDPGWFFQTAGDYAAVKHEQVVVANYGTGVECTVSCFAKAQGPVGAGEIRFGLSDDVGATFLAGCRASLTFAELSGGWKRFYFTATAVPSAGPLYFAARVQTDLDARVSVDCINVTFGNQLAPWNTCPMGVHSWPDALMDIYWRDAGWLPFWDDEIALRRAVRLTPV